MKTAEKKVAKLVVDLPELKLKLSELEAIDFHVLNKVAELTGNYFKGFQKASKVEKVEIIRFGINSVRAKAIREELAEKERESSGRQAEGLKRYREKLGNDLSKLDLLIASKAKREKAESVKAEKSKKVPKPKVKSEPVVKVEA